MAISVAENCAPIAESKVKELWTKWNAALQTLEPEKVAEMYHPESVLLPTLSNQARPNIKTKLDYFEHFLQKKPVGYIKEDYVSVQTCNLATYNGIYTFDLTAVGKKVDARFTYVYTFEDGEWKIKTHHSSLMPETTTRRNLRTSHERSVELNISPKSTTCQQISESEVRELWKGWNQALQTLSPDAVADHYWNHNAILLPTLSNQVRDTRDKKLDYFEHFLLKKPVGEINLDFISIGCNSAEYNGVYTFTLTNPSTQAVTQAMARFTYVFTASPKSGNYEWKIATHHSSLMPNPGGLSGSRRLASELVENFDRSGFSEEEKSLEFSFA